MAAARKKTGGTESAAPVTVLVAADEFITQENLNRIREEIFDGGGSAEGVVELDGASVEFEDVAVEVATPSLFAPAKLVIVKGAEKLLEKSADKLIDWLKTPPPVGNLVLIVSALDSRRKVARALAEAGTVIKCDRLHPREIPAWAKRRAAAYGKKIGDRALSLLVTISGEDMAHIDAELSKLAVYAADRDVIGTEDVQALGVGSRSFKPWDLTDAIAQGDLEGALRVVKSMLEDGTSEILLVSMLGRHVEDLIGVLMDPARLERIPSRFVREKISQQARRFTLEKLRELYSYVYEADVELKSSPLEPGISVEKLVARLAS